MTFLACAACAVVYFGLNSETTPNSWQALSRWGCYPPDQIWSGAVWGYVTSVFVHLELWHVAFNVYWLFMLGAPLERAIGSWRWLAFFVAAAFISSGAEFAFSGQTGIGASGVVYGMFGFMWMVRKRFPTFEKILDARTIGIFFIWLVACVIMSLTQVWAVGNAAHIAGLLFGMGVGAWLLYESRRRLLALGFSLLLLVAVVPLFWAPWSAGWTAWRANRAFEKRDYMTAIHWYERSMRRGEDKAWCYINMAMAYHLLGDKDHFQQTLQMLRGLDAKAAQEVELEVAGKTK